MFDEKTQFIYDRSQQLIDYPNGRRTFFTHLLNTSLIIKKLFPEEQYLIDAGLYHSVYGTCYNRHENKVSREKIRDLIGKKSENLVYIFCSLENRTDVILRHQFEKEKQRDLYILEYANILEQGDKNDRRLLDKIKLRLLYNYEKKV